jgi:hypothetical protein
MAEIDEQQDTSRATNDAYTGMLAISLIALLAGCALLYLDWSQYPSKDAPKVVAPKPNFEAPPEPKGAQPAPAPGEAKGANPMPPMPMQDKKMP